MSEKSVITCDLEGRIETFNKGAVALFGYGPEEVVGKRRVSFFSPGLIVLQHVPGWLSTAQKEGAFEGQSVFVKKDGTAFAADIKITPTYKKGQHIGYCGVTVARDDLDPKAAMPKVSFATKAIAALVVTRAPFLSATLLPLLVAAAAVSNDAGPFPWLLFGVALGGAVLLHLGANTLNDYFDHESGADEANNNYFLPYSGGSRSVELGLVKPKTLLRLGALFLAIATAAGVGLAVLATPWVIAFGLAGAFAAWAYTAPPLRLIARSGLGELTIALAFGPLLVGGMLAVLRGGLEPATALDALWLGAPLGLLTTAILWINEFPDLESDALTGKRNLVVVLGRAKARYGYVALVLAAPALVAAGVVTGALPSLALLPLMTLPLAAFTTVVMFKHYEDRSLVAANRGTIYLQGLFSALLALGILLAS
jgi:1,4-dihydroxy-2-naphthoate polyprenyltransferase